jgi:hypothetical protein
MVTHDFRLNKNHVSRTPGTLAPSFIFLFSSVLHGLRAPTKVVKGSSVPAWALSSTCAPTVGWMRHRQEASHRRSTTCCFNGEMTVVRLLPRLTTARARLLPVMAAQASTRAKAVVTTTASADERRPSMFIFYPGRNRSMADGGSFSTCTTIWSPLTSRIPVVVSTGKQQVLMRSISQVLTTSDPYDRGEVSPLTLGLGFRFLFRS